MKCWRKRAADIFAKYGIIAAKMKLAPGSVPSVFLAGIFTKAFLRLNPGLLRFLDRGTEKLKIFANDFCVSCISFIA